MKKQFNKSLTTLNYSHFLFTFIQATWVWETEVNSEDQSLKEVQELSCPLLLNMRSLGQQKQHYLETYKKM